MLGAAPGLSAAIEPGRESAQRAIRRRAQAVVAGHKVPDRYDDPRNIAETREYLRDFVRLDRVTETPRRAL
jgi:hypothetical protein